MRTFALAAYPLSGAFRSRLERESGGPVEVLVLPELRRLSAWHLVRRLRSLQGLCLLPLEDPSSEALLPILEGLAASTRAYAIEVVRSDGMGRLRVWPGTARPNRYRLPSTGTP